MSWIEREEGGTEKRRTVYRRVKVVDPEEMEDGLLLVLGLDHKVYAAS